MDKFIANVLDLFVNNPWSILILAVVAFGCFYWRYQEVVHGEFPYYSLSPN
jgi:hypothetical protein